MNHLSVFLTFFVFSSAFPFSWFRQKKYPSFQRQLNLYGFKRLTAGRDKGGYYHELFLRGKDFLAYRITRMKIKGKGARKPSSPETEPNFYSGPYLPLNVPAATSATPQLAAPTSQQSPFQISDISNNSSNSKPSQAAVSLESLLSSSLRATLAAASAQASLPPQVNHTAATKPPISLSPMALYLLSQLQQQQAPQQVSIQSVTPPAPAEPTVAGVHAQSSAPDNASVLMLAQELVRKCQQQQQPQGLSTSTSTTGRVNKRSTPILRTSGTM